jgi:hypothetical protein
MPCRRHTSTEQHYTALGPYFDEANPSMNA